MKEKINEPHLNILFICDYDDYNLIAPYAKDLSLLGHQVYLPYEYYSTMAIHETILEIPTTSINRKQYFTLDSIYKQLAKEKEKHNVNILDIDNPSNAIDMAILINKNNKIINYSILSELCQCIMSNITVYTLNPFAIKSSDNNYNIAFSHDFGIKPLDGDIFNIFNSEKFRYKKR
ncbi:MAG: hypothetical protein RR161_03445 [Bacilli bacterium]